MKHSKQKKFFLINFLFLSLLVFSFCKKNTNDKNSMTNTENVMSKDEITKLNTYYPEKYKVADIVSTFQKEKIAFKESQMGLKSMVVIGSRAVDLAIFQMEAVLNYEFGHVMDSTVIYEKSEKMNFSILIDSISNDGKVLLNGFDLMQKYSQLELFSITNDIGKELIFTNITVTKVESGQAYFSATKNTGFNLGQIFTGLLSNYQFQNEDPIRAVRQEDCNGNSTNYNALELINSKLFVHVPIGFQGCNGGDLIFTNFTEMMPPVDAEDWVYDPVYGHGQWYKLGLMYYHLAPYASYDCFDNATLNQYLNGARHIYSYYAARQNANTVITKWQLHGGWSTINMTNPPSDVSSEHIDWTTAYYYCNNNVMPH